MPINIQASINSIDSARDQRALEPLILNEFNGFMNKLAASAALAIKAGGGVLVKTTADTVGFAQGVPFQLAANTDMPALSGTVLNGTFNVFVFMRNSITGVVTSTMGTAGATYAQVKFPPWNLKQVPYGFIVVNPTGTGNFVGNTTPLDDATVVPNVKYINSLGSLDQSATIP